MKKILFVFVMAITLTSFAAADTVLLCISENRNKKDLTGWETLVLRAFEDGVLDTFFERGHIVTNSFVNECKNIAGEEAAAESDAARILGNKLGADCVIMVEVYFSENSSNESSDVPKKSRYALYGKSGKVLKESSEIYMEIDSERGEEELLDSFTVYGRTIAENVVSFF